MKVLIVYAHPREEGLNRGILNMAVETLEANNHEVTVRDLYKMNFNPVLQAEETIHIEEGKFVRDNTDYPDDVKIEQQLILEHDLLLYIFPIWWNSYPAILKGYIDRVFAHGFAYSFEDKEAFKRFEGKKALFFTTTGQPQGENGVETDLTKAIKITTSNWMFNGNGVEVLDHVFYGRVPYLTQEELDNIILDVKYRLEQLK
ncbi:NAD(P)H-dependent oxidoreductase [Vagococcus fluvialis]|uniref:NAD(P)H-dependent oxidoreductase n=1 Tax=Vagococcus fluvialis TaxID=2738 RepID=UPI003B5AFC41